MSEILLKKEKTYDSVFWTGIVKMTRFLIPLVNEAFQENYSESACIELKPLKQVMEQTGGSFDHGEVDALAEIYEQKGQTEHKTYHFELETRKNGVIAIRLAEYATSYANDHIRQTKYGAEYEIPFSSVIYLRKNSNIPENYVMTIRYPGGKVQYHVPVIKAYHYSIEELFERKLLLLLPFYGFHFADRFEEYEQQPERIVEIQNDFYDIVDRLEKLVNRGEISETDRQHLIDWSLRVFEKLTINYQNVGKGVDEFMGGYVLHTRTDDILEQGRKQGIEQGIEQGREQGIDLGRTQIALEMVRDGEITIDIAAKRLELSIEEIEKLLDAMKKESEESLAS